jgi:hypothetical protein
MPAPVGLGGVISLYGDPLQFLGKDGKPLSYWQLNMVHVPLPSPLPLGWSLAQHATVATVHHSIEDIVRRTFAELERSKAWSRLRTFDGGYEFRAKRTDSSKLSLHSYGAALDFDANTNKQGRLGDMHPDVVACFEANGWTWGGRFHPPQIDPMHFQYASGY